MKIVAKFGGTSLGSGKQVERAASAVANAVNQGHQVTVVASAMGSTTDELLDEITFDASDKDRAEIVSMGERTAIRMLKGALDAKGINARFIEPGDEYWPIVADASGEINVAATRQRCKQLVNQLEDEVPIIAGFLGETKEGNVVTLGRGGSDTTAILLGREIDADEIVIVTDVEGIMTADPNAVEGARNVGEITVDELRNLSFRGAEVVAPSALSYKTDDLRVRVIHYQQNDLLSGGTTIEGEFAEVIDMGESPLHCLTVAGRAIRNREGILAALATSLSEAGINIDAVASGMDSVTFYVDGSVVERAENIIHQEVISDESLSSVTVSGPYAVVRVLGGEYPNQPGVISELVAPLAEKDINIHDLITSATSVALFVEYEQGDATLEIIQREFRGEM
ncbi:MAG: aspartate kinase [Halobacteriaceae archaeon]